MEKKYCCGICNSAYDTIEERSMCEFKCVENRRIAEEKRKKLELEKKKEERKAEVQSAYDNYNKLLNEYVKDYGEYRTFSRIFDLF